MASSMVIYADNIVGAPYYLDPSNGLNPLDGSATRPSEIGFSAGTRYMGIPGNSSALGIGLGGSLMGHHYSQALNNLIREGSANGHYIWLFQNVATLPGQIWPSQVSFGTVIRNNKNPNNNTFRITIGQWSGVTLVEGNSNLTQIDWTQVGSIATVFRRNTVANSYLGSNSFNPVIQCGHGTVYTCGQGKYSNDTTVDCYHFCGGNKQLFYN